MIHPDDPPSISYATPTIKSPWWPAVAYYLALVCVALPLILGVLGSAGWMLFRGHHFASMCAFSLLGMIASWVIATPTMWAYCYFSAPDPRKLSRTFLVIAIAIATPIAAIGCMWITSYSRVKVVNATAVPITQFTLTDPALQSWTIASIAPGETRRRWANWDGEGSITFSANVGNSAVSGTAVGYTTSGGPLSGEDVTIYFHTDGSIVVNERE